MYIKTKDEIKFIIEGGELLGGILDELAKMSTVGASTLAINEKAEQLVAKAGGVPSFKGYGGGKGLEPFPFAICASINQEIVHGLSSEEKVLKNGDIFSIDIGMQYPKDCGLGLKGNGYFTDTSITVAVGEIARETKRFLNVVKESLEIGIRQANAGNTIADIGRSIENFVKPYGYGIVRDLVGHGVGHGVHEDPRVPNFYDSDSEKWRIRPGVVIAIEPMITMGGYEIRSKKGGWTITTADNSISAHFEHTVVVTEDGPVVATRRPNE